MASKNSSKPASKSGFFNPVEWMMSFRQAPVAVEPGIPAQRYTAHPTKRVAADHTHKKTRRQRAQVAKAKAGNTGKRRSH